MSLLTRLCSGRVPHLPLALLAAAILVGCGSSAPKVRADYDRNVNFTQYRTFGFPPSAGTDRGGYATLVTSYFKEAVTREMTARGYTFAETDPQLLVNFYSESRDKVAVYPNYHGSIALGYGYGYGRYGYPMYGGYSAWPFYEPYDVVNYQTGLLKLDLIDAKRLQTVWEASVEERLSKEAQENPQPSIARLVAIMISKVPLNAAGQTAGTTAGQ